MTDKETIRELDEEIAKMGKTHNPDNPIHNLYLLVAHLSKSVVILSSRVSLLEKYHFERPNHKEA